MFFEAAQDGHYRGPWMGQKRMSAILKNPIPTTMLINAVASIFNTY